MHHAHLGPGQFLLDGGVAGLHMASKLEVVDGVFVATEHSLGKKPSPPALRRLVNPPSSPSETGVRDLAGPGGSTHETSLRTRTRLACMLNDNEKYA